MTEVGRRSLLVGTKNDHEVGGALNELDLLPSVPKLRGKCTVVTTRLCEAVSYDTRLRIRVFKLFLPFIK
jgi:hypothetical protein